MNDQVAEGCFRVWTAVSRGDCPRPAAPAPQRNGGGPKSREALAHRKAVKKHKAAMRRAGKR